MFAWQNDPDAMAHYDVLAQNSIVEFMIKHWKDMGLTPEAEPASGEGLSMQATEEAVLQDPAGAFAASEIKTGNDVLQVGYNSAKSRRKWGAKFMGDVQRVGSGAVLCCPFKSVSVVFDVCRGVGVGAFCRPL